MTAPPRLLLVVLLLVSFSLTVVDSRDPSPFAPLRAGVDAVLGPVDRQVGRAAGTAGNAVGGVADLVDRSELQRLREENDRLRRDLAAAEADDRVGREGLDLLRLAEPEQWSVVPARVTAAGGALGFERTVTLDVGRRDGVAVGQTVVAGAGLLGRTVRVGPWTSVVLLLDDPAFGVGARLAATGALGLARGQGPGRVQWVQVEPGPVQEGQALLTTGSGTFVPGVPVGRVVEVATGRGGLTTTAVVEPFADPARVETVGVVVDPPRSQPRSPLAPPP